MRPSPSGKHECFGFLVTPRPKFNKSTLGHSEYYCGATDMVRYWSRLGFVVKHKVKTIKREDGSQKDPTWLETEREKIVQKTRGPVYLRLVEAASNIAT